MQKKTLLVCGATGFIGRNIAQTLAGVADFDVVGVYNKRPAFDFPGIRWVQADLTNKQDVERVVRDCDVIIQAAATTSGAKDIVTKPQIHITDNAIMNSLLLRAAHDNNIEHVIFFSCTVMLESSAEAQDETAFDANLEMHPRYFGIGWTKVYIEKMCEFYSRLGNTRYTVIRHSNIYGPHDKFDLERSHVMGATITKVMTAKDNKIIVWGTGEEARDLLYIDDLVDMVTLALRKQTQSFALFNCGYGEAIIIRDLIKKIIAISGKPLDIEHDLSKPSIKTSLFLDCNKAQRELGWRRATTLDTGIAKTIHWWLKNFKGEE